MSRLVTPCVLTEGLRDHEAFQAWRQLHHDEELPGRIEVLRRSKKTTVYRLTGIGPDGRDVIAKRSRCATLGVERVIYQEILPRVPVPSLGCYGYVGDPDQEFAWLFLEEVGGDAYSLENDGHRVLAGQWLGEMHLATSTGLAGELPGRRPGHYLQMLGDCRNRLELLSRIALAADDAVVVRSFVSFCDQIECRWGQIEHACAAFPEAVVHGDFAAKNVRIRELATGQALLVFDWEFAGWGVPAADLAQFIDRVVTPDLGAYRTVIASVYPRLQGQDIQLIAACGNVLRTLDQIRWWLSGLRVADPKWVAKAAALLRAYQATVSGTIERLELWLS